MNKRYCTHFEPLKCNFCNHWFSVTQNFAELQRYCLNVCPDCYDNFQYKIVHPKTYQVHEVHLISTSLFLGDSKSMLSNKFQNLLTSHKTKSYLSQEKQQEIDKIAEKQIELLQEIQNFIEPIQDKIESLYKQLFKTIMNNWNSTNQRTQKALKFYTNYKQNQINKLSDRTYNFKDDPAQIFNTQKYQINLQNLKNVGMMVKQENQNKLVKQLQTTLQDFLRKKDFNSMRDKNTLLVTPNLKNLKGLREKLVDKSNMSIKKLSIDENESKPKLLNNASLKRLKIGKQNNLNTKNLNTSQKSIKYQSSNKTRTNNSTKKQRDTEMKTPRAYNDDDFFQKLQLTENKAHQIDSYREEVSKIMKQRDQSFFQSYIPGLVTREDPSYIKNLGEKQKLQHIVELKLRTVINQKIWELINQKLNHVNINHYLKAIGGGNSLEIIRFVKVGLTDADFDQLLNFIKQNSSIHTLVLTNNKLSDASVQGLYNFIKRHKNSKLKNIYLGNNRIQNVKIKSLLDKIKEQNINLFY